MALTYFTVVRTFYDVRVSISVEPQKKWVNATVVRCGRIVHITDETNATFRSYSEKEWSDPLHWDSVCGKIAEAEYQRRTG